MCQRLAPEHDRWFFNRSAFASKLLKSRGPVFSAAVREGLSVGVAEFSGIKTSHRIRSKYSQGRSQQSPRGILIWNNNAPTLSGAGTSHSRIMLDASLSFDLHGKCLMQGKYLQQTLRHVIQTLAYVQRIPVADALLGRRPNWSYLALPEPFFVQSARCCGNKCRVGAPGPCYLGAMSNYYSWRNMH